MTVTISNVRRVARKAAFVLAATIAPLACAADDLKILVNHAPSTFYDTLAKLDKDNRVLLSTESWFAPSEANVWVTFFGSEKDLKTLNTVNAKAVKAAIDQRQKSSSLVSFNASLNNGEDLTFLVNFARQSRHGPKWQGCIAAYDIADRAYDDLKEREGSVASVCDFHKESQ